MRSAHPYRALVLPILAVLVPSIFIIVLTSWWLTLEHETAQLRSSEAATSSLGQLRTDFLSAVATEAARLESGLKPNATEIRPSSTLVADAAFFDQLGAPLGPDATTGDRDAAPDVRRRAEQLLAEGAAALESGRVPEARRAATALMDCCASARDGFGVSYALYAASQLVAVGRRQPGASERSIIRSLRDVVDRGVLDRPTDLAGIRQVTDQLNGVAGAAGLVTAAEDRAMRVRDRRAFVAAARDWMLSVGGANAQAASGVTIARWPDADAAALGAIWTSPTGTRAAMRLGHDALDDWVSAWSAPNAPFTFTVRRYQASARTPESPLVAPLFATTPGTEVAAQGPAINPASDRLRERLFMAAAGAVVALTLLAGGLAARDVVRERRLAAVRATFLAGVTHEIKTPITSIRLMAETLQQGRAQPGSSQELLGTIVNEAEHLSDLVDNLLTTSRIESGARTYRPRVIAIGDAVRAARRRFDYTLTKEGFTIVEEIPPTPLWARVDPEALEQAILNLLGNAMKYSGDSREIRVTLALDGTRALVRVADRGVGVPSSEQARIFRNFYRTATAAGLSTGTGLGLALVRHFAEAHGGEVSVESEPGHGSVFTIALPVTSGPDAITAAARVPHDSPTPTHG